MKKKFSKRKVFVQGSSLCLSIPAKLKEVFPEGTKLTPVLTEKGLLYTSENIPIQNTTVRPTPTPQPTPQPQITFPKRPTPKPEKKKSQNEQVGEFLAEKVLGLFGFKEQKPKQQEKRELRI